MLCGEVSIFANSKVIVSVCPPKFFAPIFTGGLSEEARVRYKDRFFI